MKYIFVIVLILLSANYSYSQDGSKSRIILLEQRLESLIPEIPGLSEELNIKAQNINLTTFLISVSEIHNINIDTSQGLSGIQVNNSFRNVLVKDVLLYLCKTYNLEIDFSGKILFFKNFQPPYVAPVERSIPVEYSQNTMRLSIDLKNDPLPEVLKLISTKTGKGIFYSPDLENTIVNGFINDLPLDLAMEKLAFSNNLNLNISKDGVYEFENGLEENAISSNNGTTPAKRRRVSNVRNSNFFFEVLDKELKLLEVDFFNASIKDVIYDISEKLDIDIFTATPLDDAGLVSVKSKEISFDTLLAKIFENGQNSASVSKNSVNINNQTPSQKNKQFTWKKQNDIYYFGLSEQLTVRSSELIQLKNRSVIILSDPDTGTRRAGRTASINSQLGSAVTNNGNQPFNRNQQENNSTQSLSNRNLLVNSNLKEIIPIDIQKDIEITIDEELNAFVVSGPSSNIERFKAFISEIDKKVPLIVLEVMILETNKNSSIDLGVEWGIGTEPTSTQGQIFPSTNLNLGANTVNRILGRIDGSSFFNIGKVVPNFYANIRASETNGNFKIKDSPRIATLNGHRASFSNGQTSYYAVTSQTFIGSQNPATSEIVNYQPIDAELSLEVKPFVSLDGEITMDIRVIQSNFNGERIAPDAPPGINSRELTSIVRAQSNDIIVLGGLESSSKVSSGQGVPFLARIPIIKYLFSQRTRSASKSKLSILIKPTVFY
ncbi:type II secretion system protein GspD [Dokdonia sp. Hel_I_53]|uniref:type II secretion system protein GspD n=1 Tax=Dokdonia sp. Hel_I_53 TaxID=1566287 RepID=UPI00119A7A15|nr:general secretion pathway protein GspD [Dokdonia sp. Hel_I_53]TVZ52270.1 type IV pilus assembly protein PilQ [Dokdonia sp. Hel_I_53]